MNLERAISYVLIIGVVSSLILETLGITLFYHTYGRLTFSESRTMFLHGKSYFNFFLGLLHRESSQGTGLYLMTLGIAVLILTPYIRVLMSMAYFAWERNIKYTLITLFVLILLTVSLAAA